MGRTAGRLGIMCGLPRSGKSTYAATLQNAGWVRLCPDDIRMALHGQDFVAEAEPVVWANALLSARALLIGGHNVVVDATNTSRRQRAQWLDLASSMGIVLDAFVVETSAEECQRRNSLGAARGERVVPPEVIGRMAAGWQPVEEEGIEVAIVNAGSELPA